jgi:lipase (class 3)
MAAQYPPGFSAQDALYFISNFCQLAYNQDYIFSGTKQGDGQPYGFTLPQGYTMVYEIWGVDEIWGEDESVVPFGFVSQSQGASDLVFAVRGTEGDIEWAEDLFEAEQAACPVPNSKGLVHAGFGAIYETLIYVPATTNSNTAPTAGAGVPLTQVLAGAGSAAVTGHSLGSSLATMLAMDIALNSKTAISTIYTFASPRTGDPDFASLFNSLIPTQSYRVANVWDIVPHTPPSTFPTLEHVWHYEHVNAYCPVDGGETIDVVTSHSLAAYERGLQKLL